MIPPAGSAVLPFTETNKMLLGITQGDFLRKTDQSTETAAAGVAAACKENKSGLVYGRYID